jgi:hypothetical protein
MNQAANAQRLLDRSETELLAELGSALLGRGAVPASIDVRVTAARGWLTENAEALKRNVCTDRIRALIHADAGAVALTVALGDLLMDQFAHVAPVTLAALIVRMGVDTYCQKIWAKTPGHGV